ncbi:hypothetical protein CIK05_04010 [Bdellovibrio sp. qaytius]|nr:hypothetical protein CIK05_04010 [Bdellovibrio sp. qaytius]
MNKFVLTILLAFTSQGAMAEVLSCTPNQSTYNCLVCNCYFETRGESQDGKVAVAKTVLSRITLPEFPNTVCRVVFQSSQFSWTSDSNSNRLNATTDDDKEALYDCKKATETALHEGANGLIYFYNPHKATPRWARKTTSCGRVGQHAFSVPKGENCPKYLGSNPVHSQKTKSSNGGVAK